MINLIRDQQNINQNGTFKNIILTKIVTLILSVDKGVMIKVLELSSRRIYMEIFSEN